MACVRSLIKLFSIWVLLLAGLSSFAFAETQGEISIRQESFISPDYVNTDIKSLQFFGAGIDTLNRVQKESEIDNGLEAQVSGEVLPGNSVLSYINVSQLYWKQNHFMVGRRLENWSNLDDTWRLGLYQPLFKWNPLNPAEQGLSGAFIQYQSSETTSLPWGVVLFGSPIFVPNQDSSYEVKNGKFVAANPYFKSPPSQARINGQVDQINYTVEKPSIDQVVFNQSFAAKAYIGNPKEGFLLQTAFANKPANDLSLGLDGYASPNDSVEIKVLPKIYYHQLLSADIQYRWETLGLGLSAVTDLPKNPEFDPQWTYAKYAKSNLVSPYLKVKFPGFEFLFSYLNISQSPAQTEGNLSSEAKDFLAEQYAFSNSYLARIFIGRRFAKSQNLRSTLSYQQGEKNEYALMSADLNYQFQDSWSLSLRGQLIRVADNAIGSRIAYQPFQNNDSAAVGVEYVF